MSDRNFPIEPAEQETRFMYGLMIDVAKAIEAHGYPEFAGADHAHLLKMLLQFLYAGPTDK